MAKKLVDKLLKKYPNGGKTSFRPKLTFDELNSNTLNSKTVYTNKGGVSSNDKAIPDIVQWVDPTGISNYPDLYNTFKNKNYKELPIELLGSIPMVGKVSKAIKGLKTARNVPIGKVLPFIDDLHDSVKENNFALGGKTPVKPIIVTNPNDPRLKAYEDSLKHHNYIYKSLPDYNESTDLLTHESQGFKTPKNKKNNPIGLALNLKDSFRTNEKGENIKESYLEVYKKPVQPVVYQQPTKPLPFKAKYNMPDTSASPNMQGQYPLRTFYQGTNTQREADSIEDVKALERIKLQEYMRNNPKKKLKNGGLVKYLNGGEELQQSVDPLLAMGLNTVAPGSGTAYTATRGFSNKLKESSNPYLKATGAAYDPMPLFSEFGDGKGTIAGDLLRSSGVGAPFRFAKSLVNSKADKRKAEEQKNFQLAVDAIQQANNYGASGFAPYETSTQKSLFKLGGYYKDGGNPEYATAEVEGNEHAVDPNGTGIQFEGPNHENGGIPVDLEPGTKVFSKRLKDTNGKSFAQNADRLSKKLTKATKKFEEYPNSSAIENSIAILETQRDEVFNRQEDMKITKQAKKIMKNGGLVKYAFGEEVPDILKEYITPQDTEVQTPAFNYLTDETPAGATPAQTAKFMAGETPKGYKVDLNTALPYAGSMANILMKNPKVPTYSKMPKTTIDRSGLNLMPSKFDINPQLEKSQADVRALEESVNRNISSGSGRFAASLAAKVANMRNRNELYGQKFNIENQYKGDKGRLLTQLNTQQAGMDMNVNQFNTGLANEQLENEYNRKVGNLGLTRQGLVDAAEVKQKQDRDKALTEADIQKVRIIAQRYGSGVLKRMFDKMVASGQMSKEEADILLGESLTTQ